MICGVRYRIGSALQDDFVRQGAQAHFEIAASIVIGWETFLSFAQDGSSSREEAITLLERAGCAPRSPVPPLLRPDIDEPRSRPPASSRCSAPRSAAVVLMLPVHAAAHRAMPIAGAGSW